MPEIRPPMPEVEGKSLVSERKPLVFVSANYTDHKWRFGLEERMSRYADYYEWWDSSKLDPSKSWTDSIKAAIRRANVAVVFLSQAYLSSETARAELSQLGKRAGSGRLRLFPILLEPCEWQQYPFLKNAEIWNNATPIGDFDEKAAALELEKIAASIRDLFVTSSRSPANRSQDLKFSATTNEVLAHAWSLAKQSNRGRITSSCLLFAMADMQKESFGTTPTTRFVRTALNEKGFYQSEFELFLKDGTPSATTVVSMPGIPWKMTTNVAGIIRRSFVIAGRVGSAKKEIHTRHLCAALITEVQESGVQERLRRLGVDESKLRAEFRKLIIAPSENSSEWDAVLGVTRPLQSPPAPEDLEEVIQPTPPAKNVPSFKQTYSAYLTDSVAYGKRDGEPLDDSLGVRTYASHLAQLIAAKDTPMPLAIGLFGPWGAGKSHFMDLLDEQLDKIAATPGRTFYKHIIPIRFNAWHYLDTNLWANLVSEIFDQLFNSLTSTKDEEKQKLENLKTRLTDQSALAAEAKAAVDQAQRVRKEAEQDLRDAMKKRVAEEDKVSTLLNDLINLPITEQVKRQLNDVAEGLGLPKVESSFKELEARAEEVHSLAGRTKAVLLAVFTGRGWWNRAILLGVALAAPLLVSWLAANGAPWIQQLLSGAGRTIAQIVTAITALSTWLATQVRAGNSLVGKLESAYDQVAKVRAERESKDDAAEAQAILAERKQEEEEARHKLHEAEEKLKTIKTELADMAPGRQLIRFLRQRATAEDYRRHLGLISLVRRDFKQLSDLLTGAAKDSQNLPEIDRIVLYIDDLDRCRADRVIEVLEAVQLLLAFPLFAVVVAVDPRWLRQSLLDNYPRLLGAIEDDRANARISLGRAATPQDYLEKIFQVPFNLQPLDKPGYVSLVNRFFSVNGSEDSEVRPEKSEASVVDDPVAVTEPEISEREMYKIMHDLPRLSPDIQPANKLTPTSVAAPEPRLDPERLVLTQNEIDDVERFYLLFQTPRAVKRLANTYSLIRVGVDEKEWSDYLGFNNSSPAYRVPLLLLAVTSAFPSLARPWLLWLHATPPAQWQIDDQDVVALATSNSDTTERMDWDKLQRCLKTVDLQGWPPPDPRSLEKWVPRVARYSF
jgi:hypothetical protein